MLNNIITDIYDGNIISNVCDLYQRSNLLISDFRVCDCITLGSLFNTYCMHMYGCELWDSSCKYVDEFKVAYSIFTLYRICSLKQYIKTFNSNFILI